MIGKSQRDLCYSLLYFCYVKNERFISYDYSDSTIKQGEQTFDWINFNFADSQNFRYHESNENISPSQWP